MGTRFQGTRRELLSNRSSSASAMRPRTASSITTDSEDDVFDGLVLPNAPLDLDEHLKYRKHSTQRRMECLPMKIGRPCARVMNRAVVLLLGFNTIRGLIGRYRLMKALGVRWRLGPFKL